MLNLCKKFIKDESGQDMAEYGLLLALIAVALVGGIYALRGRIIGAFEEAEAAFDGPASTP